MHKSNAPIVARWLRSVLWFAYRDGGCVATQRGSLLAYAVFFIFLGFLCGFLLFWRHTRQFLCFFVALLFFTHDICPSVKSTSQTLSGT